jgi:hypothetical protein
MAVWHETTLRIFFTQQILANYAITLNGATQIIPQNPKTIQLFVMNNSSSSIYLGADSNVSPSNGFPILPNDVIVFYCSSEFSFYLYGNNQEIRVLEAC